MLIERTWIPTPPGWVEAAAFDTDERARAHWRALVEPARSTYGDAWVGEMYRALARTRRAVAGTGVASAGLVLTTVDDAPTIWTFSTVVVRLEPEDGDPATVLARLAGGSSRVDDVTPITVIDGRTAVQALLRAPGEPTGHGMCTVAVQLPDHPRDLVVVTGASADARHRALLAPVVQSIALGVRADAPPAGAEEASGILYVDGAHG